MRAVIGHFSVKSGESVTRGVSLKVKKFKGVKFLDFLIGSVTFSVLYKNPLTKAGQGGHSHSTMKDWKYFILNDVSGIKSVSRKSLRAVRRPSLEIPHRVVGEAADKFGIPKARMGERMNFGMFSSIAIQGENDEGKLTKRLQKQEISENGSSNVVASVRIDRSKGKINPGMVFSRNGRKGVISDIREEMKNERPGRGENIRKGRVVDDDTFTGKVKSRQGNVEKTVFSVKNLREAVEGGDLKKASLYGGGQTKKAFGIHEARKAGETAGKGDEQVGKTAPQQVGNRNGHRDFVRIDIKPDEYKHRHVKGNMVNTRMEKIPHGSIGESAEMVKGEPETETYLSNREKFSSFYDGEVKSAYRGDRIKKQTSSGVEDRGVEYQKVTVEAGSIRAESRSLSGVVRSWSLKGFLVERILEIESYYRNDGKPSGTRLKVDAGQYGDMVFMCQKKEEKESIRIVVETEAIREQIRRVISEVQSSLAQKGINLDSIEVETYDQGKGMGGGRPGVPRRSVSGSGYVESRDSGTESGLEGDAENFRDMGYNTIEILA